MYSDPNEMDKIDESYTSRTTSCKQTHSSIDAKDDLSHLLILCSRAFGATDLFSSSHL